MVVTLSLVIYSSRYFWYSGITLEQTVRIYLKEDKYSGRAFEKAIWHGDSTLVEASLLTDEFKNVNYQQAKAITRLIVALDVSNKVDFAEYLYLKKNYYQKLFGSLILLKSSKKFKTKEMLFYLTDITMRSSKGLVKDLYKVRDYYSEIAIMALGYYGGDEAFQKLKEIINERRAPYSRHDAAIMALIQLKDKRAAQVLKNRLLDKDFNATFPAVKALVAMDEEVWTLVEKRLAMKLGGDDVFLRNMLVENQKD